MTRARPITSSPRVRDIARAGLPGLVLFAFMAAHAMLETARDALFLTRLGPEQLALAYGAIAVTALGAFAAVRRWSGVRDPRRILIGFLVAAATGTAAIAATLSIAPVMVFVLYVWTGLVATLVVPSFWTVVHHCLQPADAKRQFAAIGAGGVLGALLGSVAAVILSRLVATPQLVPAAALLLAVAAVAAASLRPRPSGARAARGRRARLGAGTTSRRSRRYLRLLLVGGTLATVALTIGDLMFKRVVAEQLAARDLATVFGAVYGGLNLVGLVVQILVTPRLLERLGIGSALIVLPAIAVATALGFVATGAMLAIVAFKVADGGLRHSVHRVAGEILYLPLAATLRDATKPAIDAVSQRGGQAIAAVVAFAVAHQTGGVRWLAVVAAAAAAAWLVSMVMTRAAYVQQFRDKLDAGELLRDARIPTLDGDSIALLTAALASPDEGEALAALDLLSHRTGGVPALVLYHPRPEVVRRALALLEGEVRADVARVLGHLVGHADPEIRAAALAASSRTGCHGAHLVPALADPEPAVRAAAIVALLGDAASRSVAVAAMAELTSGDAVGRLAMARAIGRAPRDELRPVLFQLLVRREPAVVREVLAVWARSPGLADVEYLVRLLADPHVRGDVHRVFAAAEERYLPHLVAALEDPRTPLAVRRHLPRTLGRMGSPRAVAALVARLGREPDPTTELKILRSLGRLRADAPDLPVDAAPLEAYVRRAVDDARRYARREARLRRDLDLAAVDAESGAGLLCELLGEERRHAIACAFRALGVLHPRADLRSVHDALTGDDEERRAAAGEILQHLVPAAVRTPLVAAIAGDGGTERVELDHERLLALLLRDRSESVRCVAAHHVAERRVAGLRPELARLERGASSSLVCRTFTRAMEILDV